PRPCARKEKRRPPTNPSRALTDRLARRSGDSPFASPGPSRARPKALRAKRKDLRATLAPRMQARKPAIHKPLGLARDGRTLVRNVVSSKRGTVPFARSNQLSARGTLPTAREAHGSDRGIRGDTTRGG